MIIKNETLLKVEILTRGVEFSENALIKARNDCAKGQNLVYNVPINASTSRPQELFIEAMDGYVTAVSCVAPNINRDSVKIDMNKNGDLIAIIDGIVFEGVKIRYIKEPEYYGKKLKNGDVVKKYVSSCGYDELNILPWKGCAISKNCKFCGVNTVANKDETDLFNAFSISKNHDIWKENKSNYISNLKEAISIALEDKCYDEHAHLIMISGNLSDESLDMQTDIYSEIAENIKNDLNGKATEGIVAVMTPPKDMNKMVKMKKSGIDIVVFNLEVGNEPWFSKYCPGKSNLGREYFIERLLKAVNIYGSGNVWTNFVFGLEPADKLIEVCDYLGKQGIVAGANVLHLDQGNQLDCSVPCKENVINFFYELAKIYKKYGFKPYYCAKALRTSLSNEAFDGRILL
jgi:hypothetical protein